MNSVKETLIAARKLIEKPENWTTFANARDKDGTSISYNDTNAVSFCAVGALKKIDGPSLLAAFQTLQTVLFNSWATKFVTYFNDHHEHREVLQAFDEAIAEADKIEANPPASQAD